jgi:hypothetical protein
MCEKGEKGSVNVFNPKTAATEINWHLPPVKTQA